MAPPLSTIGHELHNHPDRSVLVPFEAKATQPIPEVHDGANTTVRQRRSAATSVAVRSAWPRISRLTQPEDGATAVRR